MTDIKQSLIAALCTLVSISVVNATHDRPSEPRFRCGTQSCVLRRQQAITQQAQPMSPQRPTMQAPVDEPVLAEEPALVAEPEVITQEAEPISQELPTMQAPARLDINQAAVEEVDVLAQPNESEQLPASDNATEQSAMDVQPSAPDTILEQSAPEASEDLAAEEQATLL